MIVTKNKTRKTNLASEQAPKQQSMWMLQPTTVIDAMICCLDPPQEGLILPPAGNACWKMLLNVNHIRKLPITGESCGPRLCLLPGEVYIQLLGWYE